MKKVIIGIALVLLLPAGCKQEGVKAPPSEKEAKIQDNLARLDPEDRKLAELQRFCAVMPKSRLGSMGTPIKIEIDGRSVFLCCDHCEKKAKSEPEKTLARAEELKRRDDAK